MDSKKVEILKYAQQDAFLFLRNIHKTVESFLDEGKFKMSFDNSHPSTREIQNVVLAECFRPTYMSKPITKEAITAAGRASISSFIRAADPSVNDIQIGSDYIGDLFIYYMDQFETEDEIRICSDEFQHRIVHGEETLSYVLNMTDHHDCNDCGQELRMNISIVNEILHIHIDCKEPCGASSKTLADGNVKVHVPTGNIIMADALPYAKELEEAGCVPCATRSEFKFGDMTRNAADGRNSFMYFFVGNVSPDVYLSGNGALIVADTPESGANEMLGERLGGVITDLWWVSIIDAEVYEKMLNKIGVDINAPEVQNCIEKAKIDAGTYELAFYSKEQGARQLRFLDDEYCDLQIYAIWKYLGNDT